MCLQPGSTPIWCEGLVYASSCPATNWSPVQGFKWIITQGWWRKPASPAPRQRWKLVWFLSSYSSGSDPHLACFFSCSFDEESHRRWGSSSYTYYEQDLEVSAAHLKERSHLGLSWVLERRRCSQKNFRLLICLVFLRMGALKDAYGIDKMSLKVWRQCKNMWVLIVSSRHILNVTMTRTTREAPFKEKEMTHELKWRYRETRVREQGPLSSRKELGNIWSLGWTSLTLISDHNGNNNTHSVCFTKISISSSSLD